MIHRTALRLFLAILAASLCWLIPFDGKGFAQEGDEKDVHYGEDGVAYPREMQINRSGWPMGKIEPVLVEESNTEDELDVIVYFKTQDLNPITDQVKAVHKKRIEQLSTSIRALERRYRPKGPLTPAEEKSALPAMEMSMTAEEQAEMDLLREELDETRDIMREEIGAALKDATDSTRQSVADQIVSPGRPGGQQYCCHRDHRRGHPFPGPPASGRKRAGRFRVEEPAHGSGAQCECAGLRVQRLVERCRCAGWRGL